MMVVAGALSALLLSGCSAGGVSTTSSRDSAVGNAATAPENAGPGSTSLTKPGTRALDQPSDANKLAAANKSAAPAPGIGPKLTRSASLDLQVKDVAAAAARVRTIAAGLQAQVISEQIGKGGPGDPVPLQNDSQPSGTSGDVGGFGTLTLSVPSDKLDAALDQITRTRIGTVLRRNTSSQDVTTEFVDTESRLKTMRASVGRVRALMARAKDIGQVVALEGELSRRQADLESLESQLNALKTSVERSTLAVSLTTADALLESQAGGFIAGLRSGWEAFTASARGLFVALGAALPFAVFFALLGAPLWWSWRRRRANQPPAVAATAGPST
jgi:hypothetical protein